MTRFAKLAGVLLTIAMLGIPTLAQADMYVDRSIIIFEPGEAPRQDVKVSNSSEEVMYVQVDVLSVTDPGTDNEQRQAITDPKKLKLIATPNKLVIPPGGQKLVRIVNLEKNAKKERIYRINITPIVPPLQEESSQLRIVVAYQVLTIIQPEKPKTNLKVTREGTQITFTNNGNSNVLLSDGQQCHSETGECQELTSHRLYADNSWELTLPFDAPVTYSVRTFDGIKTEVFP